VWHRDGVIAEERLRTRQLLLICAVEVLAMGLWFSASSVVPQLSDEWHLSDAGATWLTTSVQLGFVAGALTSAILNLPDRMPLTRLIGASALLAAAANAAVAVFAHGLALAIPLRFLTGVALAGVYPPGIKLMATWFRAGRGFAVGALVGALALGSGTPHLVNALPALDWQAVFPEVFSQGGFDVVVGNPPYVRYQSWNGSAKHAHAGRIHHGDGRGAARQRAAVDVDRDPRTEVRARRRERLRRVAPRRVRARRGDGRPQPGDERAGERMPRNAHADRAGAGRDGRRQAVTRRQDERQRTRPEARGEPPRRLGELRRDGFRHGRIGDTARRIAGTDHTEIHEILAEPPGGRSAAHLERGTRPRPRGCERFRPR